MIFTSVSNASFKTGFVQQVRAGTDLGDKQQQMKAYSGRDLSPVRVLKSLILSTLSLKQ